LLIWDGRRRDLEGQSGDPFLNPVEMNLPSHDAIVDFVPQGLRLARLTSSPRAILMCGPRNSWRRAKKWLPVFRLNRRDQKRIGTSGVSNLTPDGLARRKLESKTREGLPRAF